MAKENIAAFQERLAQDESLREELNQVQKENGNLPVAEVIRIAGAHGFDFSLEDVRDTLENGELSDEELDQVAGGATTFTISWYKPLLGTSGKLRTNFDLLSDKTTPDLL